MRKIGREPTPAMAFNLKKMTSIAWLGDFRRIMDQIDDAGQHSAVRFVMAAGIPRQQVLGLVETVLLHGKPGGRSEAARALAEFQGAEANALAMRALADPDPQVQANIIPQLRGRGIPGVLPSLMELVESPYPVVRKAARESLAEFSFKRFVAAFDMLDEEVRRSTGTAGQEDRRAEPIALERRIEIADPHARVSAAWRSPARSTPSRAWRARSSRCSRTRTTWCGWKRRSRWAGRSVRPAWRP